ncbi:MAG TPA: hypothetical protein VFH49_04235, partial [Aquabacterium sp.]|nr:hypothetical protein [Aquabacterium sp.]
MSLVIRTTGLHRFGRLLFGTGGALATLTSVAAITAVATGATITAGAAIATLFTLGHALRALQQGL